MARVNKKKDEDSDLSDKLVGINRVAKVVKVVEGLDLQLW